MSAPRIFFIRHGQTDWNVEGRLQGQQDIPLNARGRKQAEQAGRTARKLLGTTGVRAPDLVFQASPLGRTRETMEIARRAMGLPAEGYAIDERLVELTFGAWEGLTWPEVQQVAPQAASWREGDKWNFVPPGGESYGMLAQRLAPWLAELDRDIVVVAHGGVARVLMAVIGGLAAERAAVADVWQGRVAVFAHGRFDWV